MAGISKSSRPAGSWRVKEVKGIRMNDFIHGFIKGAKETPRGFFAPVILLCRLFIKSYDSVIQRDNGENA